MFPRYIFVKNFLKSLKRKRAIGMLKDCHQHLIDLLHHIINMSLHSGILLSAWKKTTVVPLFKFGLFEGN